MTRTVAALYVDPRGPYPTLPGVEAWDASRDARGYAGPHAVVAHPPCGPWGRLASWCRHQDASLGPLAVEQVRRWGGVLEHPAGSRLFAECGMPAPGELPDGAGGITIAVNQCDWGHVALKPTWLNLVGVPPGGVFPRMPKREPTHWVSGSRTRRTTTGGKAPPGVKMCSAEQRRRTPRPFAELLVELARASEVPA